MHIFGIAYKCEYETALIIKETIGGICLICGLYIAYLGFKGFCGNNEIQPLFKIAFVVQSITQLILGSTQIVIHISCQTMSEYTHLQNIILYIWIYCDTIHVYRTNMYFTNCYNISFIFYIL